MAKRQKVPVSERALFARIDRALDKQEERLRRCRPGSRSHWELGDYYVINWRIGGLVHKDVDIEDLGRELGVLRDYEKLESE